MPAMPVDAVAGEYGEVILDEQETTAEDYAGLAPSNLGSDHAWEAQSELTDESFH